MQFRDSFDSDQQRKWLSSTAKLVGKIYIHFFHDRQKRKIHHLRHNHNQSSLSHERRLAPHIRPGDEHACALTFDRCLLVAVTVLEKKK